MELIDNHIKLLLKNKDLQNPNSFEDLGYNFFGPIVFNFFDWLRNEINECDLVLFNSREGYFLYKYMKYLKKNIIYHNTLILKHHENYQQLHL